MLSFIECDDDVVVDVSFEMFRGLTDSRVVVMAEERCVCVGIY